MGDQLLIIFTRNPELGKVKTRLAASVGAEAALKIYELLLQHTREVCSRVPFDKHLYFTESVPEKSGWDPSQYSHLLQHGNDLGEKMRNAIDHGFQLGYKKICLIGSDLYDLRAWHLLKAFDALDNHEVVIGPAHDGGYYLVGMQKPLYSIFLDKAWGSAEVFSKTMVDLSETNVFLLDELNDIDTVEDLKSYPNLMNVIDKHD